MSARLVGRLAGLATLAASGTYVFVYLYRWEWNRALVSAAIFLMAEVAMLGSVLVDRLRRLEGRVASAAEATAAQRRLDHLRSSAPPPSVGFAWMAGSGSTNVFIPVLLGAGAVLSGLAWVVERLARATAGRAAEQGLARRLGTLELPAGGLLASEPDPLALLRGPVR
jgi:hypothetical protein